LILNWFLAEGTISAGIAEGLNNKAKLAMRKAYGFRTEKAITIALYHQLGAFFPHIWLVFSPNYRTAPIQRP